MPETAQQIKDVRERVLRAVANQDITRRYGNYRWWLDEHNYRTLTERERIHVRAAQREGQIEFVGAPGYRHTMIGGFYLTPIGRLWLAERDADG